MNLVFHISEDGSEIELFYWYYIFCLTYFNPEILLNDVLYLRNINHFCVLIHSYPCNCISIRIKYFIFHIAQRSLTKKSYK